MAVKEKTLNEKMAKTPAKAKKAVALLEEFEQISAEVEALMAKHGISEKLAEAAEKKKKATEIIVGLGIKSVPMPGGGRYDLRQDAYNKKVVADNEDLEGVKNPAAVIPLKQIIRKKFGKDGWQEFWRSITTRKVDEAKLLAAVNRGEITLDEITPAYYQDLKSPYLRKYD